MYIEKIHYGGEKDGLLDLHGDGYRKGGPWPFIDLPNHGSKDGYSWGKGTNATCWGYGYGGGICSYFDFDKNYKISLPSWMPAPL